MSEYRNHTRAADAIQLAPRLGGNALQRKLDEHCVRPTQAQVPRTQIHIRLVQHDLPAQQQLEALGRHTAQLLENGAVALKWSGGDPRCRQVRREHKARHSVGDEPFHDGKGHVDGS